MDIDRKFEVGNSKLECNKPHENDWASVEIVREEDFGDPNHHLNI